MEPWMPESMAQPLAGLLKLSDSEVLQVLLLTINGKYAVMRDVLAKIGRGAGCAIDICIPAAG